MKKLLLLGLIITGTLKLSHAGQDMLGSQRPAVWRSSFSMIPDGFGILTATGSFLVGGSYILHGVLVSSPTYLPGTTGVVAFFNSTTTNATLNQTTVAMVMTNTQLGTSPYGAPNWYPYDIVFTTGIVYNKIGGAWTTILWDYVIPNAKYP